MTPNRVTSLAILATTIIVMAALSVSAAEPVDSSGPYGKNSSGWYVGGTSGRSGIDSLRGYVDSIFYSKAAQSMGSETVAGPQGVIYGDDDRRDIYTLTDPNLLKLAQATCVVVESYEITNNGNGTYTLHTTPWTSQSGYPLCAGERFVGQRQIGFCSGFLVGSDIVVTAGHCVNTCTGVAFVFGFQQIDSLTPPVTVVSADNVYFCSQVMDRQLQGDYDHSVVRLDRPVVGRSPIPIRRDGLVDNGAPLVLIGHPTVLPMKTAAGAEVKNNKGTTPWFEANTDSYGGNSGSMVVNTNTWKIEGILVRGEPDFVVQGSCIKSNVLPNSGSGSGFEEISKITTVASLIPELLSNVGELTFDAAYYRCSSTITIELRDQDLAGLGSMLLPIATSAADSEMVTVAESPTTPGIFTGSISVAAGGPVKGDGQLQVSDADIITATYNDADHGGGTPATVTTSATVDCSAPLISNVTITQIGVTWFRVTFNTDEAASGHVRVGSICGSYTTSGASSASLTHDITVSGLSPTTGYRFEIEASDAAGNVSIDDNAGACYEFTTNVAANFFTEQFSTGLDLANKTLALIPDGSADFYRPCLYDSPTFPAVLPGETNLSLTDDDSKAVTIVGGQSVSLYGTPYSQVYVGSNGFVTFGASNTDWSETLEEHFAAPPRVAVFWDDLDPTEGGTISYQEFDDRLLVTWRNVHAHLSAHEISAQLALYFDGVITMTYGVVQEDDCIVGLSRGAGMPADFIPSDLSSFSACQRVVCYADADSDTFGASNDPGSSQFADQCPPGYEDNSLDCDDTNPDIHPGVSDIPDDAIDQDCDGRDASCCLVRVGDVNGAGGDEPTIGDISMLIDHLFVSGLTLNCLQEADVNQSGGRYPTLDDITIGDISMLIDHLFVSGMVLGDCL